MGETVTLKCTSCGEPILVQYSFDPGDRGGLFILPRPASIDIVGLRAGCGHDQDLAGVQGAVWEKVNRERVTW